MFGKRLSTLCSRPGEIFRGKEEVISDRAQWEESFFPKTSVTIVILFWLKWAGYLAVAGLNLLAQLSDRRSPYGV